MNFTGQGRPITDKGMSDVCELLGVGEAEIWAVLTVETRGFGFLDDRRPQILFERHIFSRQTGGKHDAKHGDISSTKPGAYKGGAGEYDRLGKAMRLAQEDALKSTSWGLPQVMGFNYRVVGFDSVTAMINAFVEGEDPQLQALGQFIVAHPKCRNGIQRHDWGTLASCYNGPNFRLNDYDNRLAAAYEKAKRIIPDLGLRAAQVALTYLGYNPGPVDGLRGRLTRSALIEFQTKHKLTASGELDHDTDAKLTEEAFKP